MIIDENIKKAFCNILQDAAIGYIGDNVTISGCDPVLPSRYLVGTAGAAALAAVGCAASSLWYLKTGLQQQVGINVYQAALAQLSNQYVKLLDGKNEALWDPISGFYTTRDNRHIQLHCNFPHHKQGVLNFLACDATKDAVKHAILHNHDALGLETALNKLGLCASMVRTRDEWNCSEQGAAVAKLPLFEIIKIKNSQPIPLPKNCNMPLSDINMLDLTRVIAGPVCARTFAELGANVIRVGSPNLPEIYQLYLDTGRGKESVNIDLNKHEERDALYKLIQDADIFSQAYRPGAIDSFGLSVEDLADIRPGIIYISLSAYSHCGPWNNRHGYDSLVQSTTGIAYTQNGEMPKHLPCQTLDYVAGFIGAFAAMEALRRRAIDGGSYLIRISLVQVANWLISLGLVKDFGHLSLPNPEDILDYLTITQTEFGRLQHLKPVLKMSLTPPLVNLPLVQIGSSTMAWPNKIKQ